MDPLADLSAEFTAAENALHGEDNSVAKQPKDEPTIQADTQEADVPELEEGEISAIKDLYASQKSTCKCCRDWVDEKPFREDEEHERAKKKAETKRATFALNRRREPHGTAGSWKTHSIKIYSARLRDVLDKVFKDYPMSYYEGYDVVLEPPYAPFHHQWQKLLDAEQDERDPTTKSHITLLREALEEDIGDKLTMVSMVRKTLSAQFSDLFYLYRPGETLIKKNANGVIQAGLLSSVKLIQLETTSYYDLEVETVLWNGTMFGVEKTTWTVYSFSGTKEIVSLDVAPLSLHPKGQDIEKTLIARGSKYESLTRQLFKWYNGPVSLPSFWSSSTTADKRVRRPTSSRGLH